MNTLTWDTPAAWLQRWRSGEILIAPPVVLMLRILEEHAWAGAGAELVELTRGFARGKLHPIFYNPAVQLLPLETPTLPPATHTNAYLIGRDPATDDVAPTAGGELKHDLAGGLVEAREGGTICLEELHDDLEHEGWHLTAVFRCTKGGRQGGNGLLLSLVPRSTSDVDECRLNRRAAVKLDAACEDL